MAFKVPMNDRPSASAEDADQHLRGQDAAQAETQRINAWTNPSFAGGGRHQAQLDDSYNYKERRTGR